MPFAVAIYSNSRDKINGNLKESLKTLTLNFYRNISEVTQKGLMMKRFWILPILATLLAGVADAGPVRERIKARLEAKKAVESQVIDVAAISPGARKLTLSYGDSPKQAMDVYVPADARDAPVIVMVHGGAWKIGDKANSGSIENKLKYWLPKGYIFISVNYRLLPEAMAYEQAQDVAAAMRFTQKNATTWGGSPDKIVLMGHSAGAHIVALLSSNPPMVGANWRGTVVLDSAVMSVPSIMERRHLGFYDEAFGADKTYWLKASPMDQWTPKAVPMMVVCSSQRKDKPCVEANAFKAKVTKAGHDMIILPQNLTHEEINRTLGMPGPYTSAVDDFITSRLKPAP
ncbi:alpha/beta hydrolase [Asticcacaulis machinosus]|uniref:Alpha/beta hydrolase n=1 Tax=Asticcacaulis machinosus TaxID=2984211 RepID=A0ABT5HE68_9CAUL|nr:alpha/beta hydrolase [Asticcacaulis machinosus]MDC7674555.1 alpha/beta hydrolase [Asticcacaulis machinosus]